MAAGHGRPGRSAGPVRWLLLPRQYTPRTILRSFSYSLSLQWFILFLQLLVIIAIPVLSLMGKIHSVKLFMIHMLAIPLHPVVDLCQPGTATQAVMQQ